MFGSKKKEEVSTNGKFSLQKTSPNGLNSLVAGATLEGNVTAESDFRIDGHFKGNLICKAKVIVGPSGVFDGDMKAENAVIEGMVIGKIQIFSTLEVKETGIVNGDVATENLIIANGAKFNVTCSMNQARIIKNDGPKVLSSSTS
jgi:cytoskeletal protein CcmA (bactofilin family)